MLSIVPRTFLPGPPVSNLLLAKLGIHPFALHACMRINSSKHRVFSSQIATPGSYKQTPNLELIRIAFWHLPSPSCNDTTPSPSLGLAHFSSLSWHPIRALFQYCHLLSYSLIVYFPIDSFLMPF